MEKLIQDRSFGQFYTKTRRVGHVLALVVICAFAYQCWTGGVSLRMGFEFAFLILGWFIFIPVEKFIGDSRFYENDPEYRILFIDMLRFQERIIDYVMPAAFNVGFIVYLWFLLRKG